MSSPGMKQPILWHQTKINGQVQKKKPNEIVGAEKNPFLDRLNDFGNDLTDAFLRPYAGVFDEGGFLENYEDPDDDELYYLPPAPY